MWYLYWNNAQNVYKRLPTEGDYSREEDDFDGLTDTNTETSQEEIVALLRDRINEDNVIPHVINSFRHYGSGWSLLHKAINSSLRNKGMIIETLLERGANPNCLDAAGLTPLHSAVELYEVEEDDDTTKNIVQLLLKFGADPNSNDIVNGKTPLHSLLNKYSENEDTDNVTLDIGIIALLLHFKADPNGKDKDGNTPFHYAIMAPNYENLINLLLLYKGDIQGKNNNSETLIFYIPYHVLVSRTKLTNFFKFLLEKGVDITIQNNLGQTFMNELLRGETIWHCKEWSCKNLAKIIAPLGIDIYKKDLKGNDCIHTSLKKGNFKLVFINDKYNYFLKYGLNFTGKNNKGKTYLHCASRSGNKELVEFLIDQGLSIHDKTTDGKTCLHYAAQSDNKELVEFFIEQGLNIQDKTTKGQTCLHLAAPCGDKASAVFFIQQGLSIHDKTLEGKTCLHLAVDAHNTDLIQFFLEKGLFLYDKTNDDKTCLYGVKSRKISSELADLINGTIISEFQYHKGSPLEVRERIKSYIKDGFNINAQD